MLGKRKRESLLPSRRMKDLPAHRSDQAPASDATEIFRRHFETTFAPLPEEQFVNRTAEDDLDAISSDAESEASEWSGISKSSSHVSIVEIVDGQTTQEFGADESHRSHQKAFMSSRPPRDAAARTETRQVRSRDEDDPAEKLNLKHDLDLQRLLKESHLLEKSKASDNPGKQRQKAIDMRLQALGTKKSTFTQQKMPLAHRIGITRKADQKEATRRKDAKENGVILEKATKKANKGKQRERGVDVPGVGKFAGGTLKLSRRDVASIQGPSPAARRGKRK